MKKVLFALAAVSMAFAAQAPAARAAMEVSGDAYISVYSKYLFRGFDLSPDDNFVVQPGTDVSVGGFTLSWWGNFSENTGELNEVDITLDYTADLGDLASVSVGNILYDADGLTDTNELYLGVTLNTLLSPSVTVYYDYDEFETVYTTLGVSQGFDLTEGLSLGLGATASYFADDQNGLGTDESWLHNLELSAALDYALAENLSLGGSALYSTPLSDDAENIAGIDDEFAAGLALTLAF